MRIDELLARGPTSSFEFFPPTTDAEASGLERTLEELADLKPSFVSVTYRGGAASRPRTYALVRRLHELGRYEPMAHLTCVHHSRDELVEILGDYERAGVENLMLLGGDRDPAAAGPGEVHHAIDLVRIAREAGTFSIGVASHPAGHPDSPDLASDRRFLAEKLELADFSITQFFFHVDEWRRLVDDLDALGIDKPVLPGIMPVETMRSLTRMRTMGGVVPDWLAARLAAAEPQGPAAVRAAGIAAAAELCADLLDAGAPGLHFYTLNRSTATREIFTSLEL